MKNNVVLPFLEKNNSSKKMEMRKNFQKNMNKDHKQKHKEETKMKKGTWSREGVGKRGVGFNIIKTYFMKSQRINKNIKLKHTEPDMYIILQGSLLKTIVFKHDFIYI